MTAAGGERRGPSPYRTAAELEEERLMLLSPEEWPLGDFLPLKRHNEGGGFPDFAVARYINGLLHWTREGEIFRPPEDPSAWEPVTAADLIGDGWVVD